MGGSSRKEADGCEAREALWSDDTRVILASGNKRKRVGFKEDLENFSDAEC